MTNKVAFVLYRYPLGVSTMVVNSMKLFGDRGILVDIYIDRSMLNESPTDLEHRAIRFHVFEPAASKVKWFICAELAHVLRPLVGVHWSKLGKFLYRLKNLHAYAFSKWLRGKCNEIDYDYIFPVEAPSLVACNGLRGRIVYFNMELLDWEEYNPTYGKDLQLKRMEYEGLANVHAVIIQNRRRAEAFRRINHYTKPIYILPVASMGEPIRCKSAFFRDKYVIPDDDFIVLYAGNVDPWAKCVEIVESVKRWPGHTRLVVHSWLPRAYDRGYGRKVREHAKGLPVHLSTGYIDGYALSHCISSADIGLLFYDPHDANFVEILFSSNKLGEYLKAGLPVIAFGTGDLGSFVAEHGIGETVSTIEELPSALRKILAKHEEYRCRVFACYESVYRFEPYFAKFASSLYAMPTGEDKQRQLVALGDVGTHGYVPRLDVEKLPQAGGL